MLLTTEEGLGTLGSRKANGFSCCDDRSHRKPNVALLKEMLRAGSTTLPLELVNCSAISYPTDPHKPFSMLYGFSTLS